VGSEKAISKKSLCRVCLRDHPPQHFIILGFRFRFRDVLFYGSEIHGRRQLRYAFEKAVELSPDWPEARNALGEAYVQLLRFEDAVAEFDKALELKHDYARAKINRRRTMMSVERYKPVEGSRLNRWHKFAILGGITAAITLISALALYLSS
jgi:tetratricopeptide (TPR) repeat protein